LPQLEYDLESAREELHRKFLESRPAPKKRKFDLEVIPSAEEKHKRTRKKIDYVVDKKTRAKRAITVAKSATEAVSKEKKVSEGVEEEKSEKRVFKGGKINHEQDVTAKKKKSVDKSDPKHDKEMAHEAEVLVAKEVKKKSNKKDKAA